MTIAVDLGRKATKQTNNTIFKLLTYLSILVTPKCVLWQTVKTQMECNIIQHFIIVYVVCYGKTDLQEKKYVLCGN